ncbi:MAG: hypothetical protein R3B99_05360 [Polyangiales bacterium]|nr:hypothetical protein [Myxococcales bacterium]
MRRSLLLLLAAACGDSTPPTAPPEPTPPVEAPAAVEPLELHEWGLISDRVGGERVALGRAPVRQPDLAELLRGGEGIGAEVGIGIGPGTLRMRAGGKPVIYAHLPEGVDERRFDLGVRVPNGSVVEHWPKVAEGRPAEIAWRNVRAHRGACAERRYPSADDPVCQTPDGFCEAALAPTAIETADGACLEVNGASFDYLFYRAGMPSTPLPLEVTRADDGALTVRHRGGGAIPGRLIHVRRGATRAQTVLQVVESPAPGATTELAALPAEDPASRPALAIARLAAGARELGLSSDELGAFGRAWHDELLGYESPVTTTELPASLEAPTEALLYWMPPEELDAHLVLRTSEDVVVRRAILVRVGLAYAP